MVKPGKIQLAEKNSWEDGYKSFFQNQDEKNNLFFLQMHFLLFRPQTQRFYS